MKNNILRISIGIFLLALFGFYWNFVSKKNLLGQDIIYIGMMNGWAPYMSINGVGEMEGFDVDVVKSLETVLPQIYHKHREIKIVDFGSLSALFLALEQGKVHAIMSGLDITSKRKANYAIIPYRKEKMNNLIAIFTSDVMASQFKKGKSNLRIGIESGTSWEEVLNSYNIENKLYFNSVSDLLLQLRENKLDGIVLDSVQYNRISNRLKIENTIKKIEIPDSFVIDGIGIVIKKGNENIFNMLSEGIKILFHDGIIEALEAKWNLVE